jgi:hypothetical protein
MQQQLRYQILIYFAAAAFLISLGLIVASNPISGSTNTAANKVGDLAQSTGSNNLKQDLTRHNWLTYNVQSETKFKYSTKLQSIVDRVVQYNKSKQLPIDRLSVTLIDLKTSSQASYQSDVLRYPASIVKLFWLVGINQLLSDRKINKSEVASAMDLMILKSDNYAASQILDIITQTKSTLKSLPPSKLAAWQAKREQINTFFRQAGYSSQLNVSQKTFPILQQNISQAVGADKQTRDGVSDKSIRNQVSTNDISKLMYEIVTNRAVDPQSSLYMQKLLTRNIDPDYWKKQPPNPVEFNPVESFFGEGLATERNLVASFISKAGCTSTSRQEVAYIHSSDGKSEYILVAIGDDIAYKKNKDIFPQISQLVARQMFATN